MNQGRNRSTRTRASLQRTMIIYFLLIGFASLLVGVEFIVETHSHQIKTQLLENISQYTKGQIEQDQLLAPLSRLRSKAILMVGIVLLVMVIVLTMFIKNITEPLQHMIELSKKISGGDLSPTVVINTNDELAQLGNVINEMSSNLQEIILLSQNMCASGKSFVDRARQQLTPSTVTKDAVLQLRSAVDALEDEVTTLDEVIAYFNFYTVDRRQDRHG